MTLLLIVVILAGIILTGYAFFASSKEVKDKRKNESSISELKHQVISSNVKMQKSEFEYSALQKEIEKMKKEIGIAKNELEICKEDGEIKLKQLQGKHRVAMEMLQAESITLKEKILEKESQNRKLIEEVKILNERVKLKETNTVDLQKKDEIKNTQKGPKEVDSI